MNREFLQLAKTYDPDKDFIAGKMVSEKLDGMRCFWDGGISRGIETLKIPWANTKKSNAVPVATGLWSRYGNPINAPDYWLNALPDYFLDGELYLGRQSFQDLMKICRSTVNVKYDEWSDVQFMIIDSPHPDKVFMDGKINSPNYEKLFTKIPTDEMPKPFSELTPFSSRYRWLQLNLKSNKFVQLHQQTMLSCQRSLAEKELQELNDQILEAEGEGLIIKSPNDLWLPKRVRSVLKVKPWYDAEATVIGYKWGRKTKKGSKFLGLMGALIVASELGIFKIGSGFTNEERVMYSNGQPTKYTGDPGKDASPEYENPKFPRGTVITYKFRELTDEGIPKDGRHHRITPT